MGVRTVLMTIVAGFWTLQASGQLTLSTEIIRSGESYQVHLAGGMPGGPYWTAIDWHAGPAVIPGLGGVLGLAMSPGFFVFPEGHFDDAGGSHIWLVMSPAPELVGHRIFAQTVAYEPSTTRHVISNLVSFGVHPGTAAGGQVTSLMLGDDQVEPVLMTAMNFRFFGRDYDTLHVGSNGRISFDGGDPLPVETAASFLGEEPSVAALWDDLDPSQGGQVIIRQDPAGTFVQVSYKNIPQFGLSDASSVDVTLTAEGAITLEFGQVTTQDALVGISPGNAISAALPININLHSYMELVPQNACYEVFTTGLDLAHSILSFVPVVPGKYALLVN